MNVQVRYSGWYASLSGILLALCSVWTVLQSWIIFPPITILKKKHSCFQKSLWKYNYSHENDGVPTKIQMQVSVVSFESLKLKWERRKENNKTECRLFLQAVGALQSSIQILSLHLSNEPNVVWVQTGRCTARYCLYRHGKQLCSGVAARAI